MKRAFIAVTIALPVLVAGDGDTGTAERAGQNADASPLDPVGDVEWTPPEAGADADADTTVSPAPPDPADEPALQLATDDGPGAQPTALAVITSA